MVYLRQHIALTYLLIFLTPQIGGTLHFLTVFHPLNDPQQEVQTTIKSKFDYHACTYHFKNFEPLVPQEEDALRKWTGIISHPGGFLSEMHNNKTVFNYRLRGPPMERYL